MLTRNTQKLVWPPKMQCGVMQSKVTSSSRSSTGGSSIHGGVPLDRAASTKWAYVCKPKTLTATWEYNSNTDQVDCSCKPKEHFFFFGFVGDLQLPVAWCAWTYLRCGPFPKAASQTSMTPHSIFSLLLSSAFFLFEFTRTTNITFVQPQIFLVPGAELHCTFYSTYWFLRQK